MEHYQNKLVIAGVHTLRQLTDEKYDFWIKSEDDEQGRDVLAQHKYRQAFLWWNNNSSSSSSTTEASRASALVKMHHLHLAQRLSQHDWSCLFPNIVANENTIQVLSPASSEDNPHGTLRVVYKETQATSPVVPNRKFTVLRSCTQIDQATWLIAEVSHVPSPNTYRRLPSGCLIQRISDYESKVTWVEHTEVIAAQFPPNQTFYHHLIRTGFAFLAHRMVAWLETLLERLSHANLTCDMLYEVPWVEDKLNMLDLGEIMARDLFQNVTPNEDRNSTLWRSATGPQEEASKVYATLYKSSANLEVALGVVTFAVKHSPDFVLETLADERTQLEWDVLGGLTQPCAFRKYSTGGDSRNYISASSMIDGSRNEMLIKEVNVNRYGSLILWSTVSLKAFDVFSHTKEFPKDPLLISGVSITANGHTATTNTGGSVITLALRKLVQGNQPLQEKSQQSIESIIFAINQTVGRAKEALEKHQPPSPGTWPTEKQLMQDELRVLRLD